jgi:predicted nuclease of predicted toxin-antitoxin system
LPARDCRRIEATRLNVTTTSEADLISASDEQQTAYARNERRVIFTQDKDFLRINASGISHAGIVDCRQGKEVGSATPLSPRHHADAARRGGRSPK